MRSDARKRLQPEQVTTLTMTATQFAEEIRNAREAAWDEGYEEGAEDQISAYWGTTFRARTNPYQAAS